MTQSRTAHGQPTRPLQHKAITVTSNSAVNARINASAQPRSLPHPANQPSWEELLGRR